MPMGEGVIFVGENLAKGIIFAFAKHLTKFFLKKERVDPANRRELAKRWEPAELSKCGAVLVFFFFWSNFIFIFCALDS